MCMQVCVHVYIHLCVHVSMFTLFSLVNLLCIIISAPGLLELRLCFQENDSKRARAVKKANDERELKKQKDKEIDRSV